MRLSLGFQHNLWHGIAHWPIGRLATALASKVGRVWRPRSPPVHESGVAATAEMFTSRPVENPDSKRQCSVRADHPRVMPQPASSPGLVIEDQLAVETAYENFLEIIYPGDSASKQAARENNAPAHQMECEMAARQNFEQHGAFDFFSSVQRSRVGIQHLLHTQTLQTKT